MIVMTSSHDGYEKKDVNIAKIVGYTVVITVLLAAILIFLFEYFIYATENIKKEAAMRQSSQLRELRAAEEEALNNYKLLDAENNRYQIPIERAMELVANEAFIEQKLEK